MTIWQKLEGQTTPDLLVMAYPGNRYLFSAMPDGRVVLQVFRSPDYSDGRLTDRSIDTFEIADVDDMIQKLTSIRDEAKQHFGNDWGRGATV